ncbi:DNA methylase [Escherichia coli]|nr:DNA methylase [Escherichia coli]SQZ42409.1 DNA methylase [Escherichia coli]SQZ52478.1 DNA methylase [Escherichia coli]SRB16269.1 DNA methylase [Escherichia coli]SVF91820.1 DNA methylase [Escherichia coli]
MTSLKTSIKTITYLSDIGCLEIQGASLVTRKLQDSFYINVSWDALNTAYSEHPEWFSGLVSGDEN